MADFYYRYNNGGDTLLLNDAYLGQANPVTTNLNRRFMASDLANNVWKDAVTGTTVSSSNMTVISHIGNQKYRTTNVVEFTPSGYVNFNNSRLDVYTLFTITRYNGAAGGTKGRIITGATNNFLSGHWNGNAGVAHHDNWITVPQVDIHGTNFFIGTDIATQYFTNGLSRAINNSPLISFLPPMTINNNEASNGQFLDILMYDRQLTELERKKVEQYLASYYGILDKAGTLTAYYNRAPTATETSLLVSTAASPNWIVYPSFNIAQTGLTFAMWFRMNGIQDNSRLMDFGTGVGMNNIIIAGNPTGGLQFAVYTPNVGFGGGGTVTPAYTDDVWRHLVWTISADGLTWKIYINKVLLTTINSSNYATYGGSSAPNHPASVLRTLNYIGLDNFGGSSRLKGAVEDFQMYNYPLDQTAITQTWNMVDSWAVDNHRSLLPKYGRPPLSTETSMLVSSIENPNFIIYPAFTIAQTGLTFAMWFQSNTVNTWTRLFDFGNGAQVYNIIAAIKDGNLAISVQNNIGSVMTKSEFWNVFTGCIDNVWRHFVWTISVDGRTWQIYINKVLHATITASTMNKYSPTTAGSVAPYHPESVIRATNYIGKSSFGDPAYSGSIHAFQMWNSPLSMSAIQALYNDTAFNGQYTLSQFPNMERPLSMGSFTLPTPDSTGSGSFSFSSSNTAVATIVDNVVTLKSVGTTTITAKQWTTTITATLTVGTKVNPVLGPFVLPLVAVGYAPFSLTPPSSLSTGSFSYTSSDPTVASISGSTVTVLKIGTTTITATQATDTNYNAASLNALLTVSENSLPEFYYRFNRGSNDFVTNDAYMLTNPVPVGIHRRFKASDYNPNTKVWTDSANGNTIVATGNVRLVPHIGDKKYRPLQAVEFDTTGSVDFRNDILPQYTLFYVTRYTSIGLRIISSSTINFLAGHWGGYAGVEYHNKWLTNPNPQFNQTPAMNLHSTDFFVGSSTSTDYYTNGIKRTTETDTTNMLTYLPSIGINYGIYPYETSNCQVLDILMYNRVLSDTERRKVEQYLSASYGILESSGVLTAKYNRAPLTTETSLLDSTRSNPNWIVYPAFSIAQTGFSVALWFKASIPSGFTSSDTNFTRLFDFGVGSAGSQTYAIAALLFNNNLRLAVTTTTDSCTLNNVFSGCNDNVWRHLVWTISADGLTWRIYVNKVLKETITSANYTTYSSGGTVGPYHPATIARTTNFLGKSTSGSHPPLNGSIDEFQMFNYSLDQNAINALYTVNTVKTLSVNVDQGSLLVPIAGTSFVSSDTRIATVTGAQITFLKSGTTTITSNLHSNANPIQLVLTVTRNGTGFVSGTMDLLEQIDPNSIQTLTIKPTSTCQSGSISSKNLYAKNIQVNLEGVSNTGDTSLTFGKTKPNLWIATGNGTNSLAYSSDGINWTGLGNSIFAQGRGISWNGKIWVAGGDSVSTNTLAYSYDGINWVGLGTSIFSTGCNCFAWNGQMWIAGGNVNNTLAYSYDGINWTGLGKTIFSEWCGGIVWNGIMFVACGSGTNGLAYSYDGINWTGAGTSILFQGDGVAWNGTLWVSVGEGGSSSNTIAYSYNGTTWTGLGKNLFTNAYNISYNGTLFVAVGDSTLHKMAYSYDGLVWVGLGISIFSTRAYSITWSGEMFMAGGEGTNTLAYSYDGIRWIGLGANIFTNRVWGISNNAAYENRITVRKRMSIVGGRGANTLSYSYDGITWKGLGNSIFAGGCYGVAYNGTIWVAVGYTNTKFAYSYDGIQWFANTSYNALFTDGMCVMWNGTLWVASGGAGTCTLAYSYDGIIWVGIEKTTFSGYCMGLATNGKRWVGVGGGTNTLAYSEDGIKWIGLGSTIFTGLSFPGMSVAWNGTMFVASGAGTNNLAYSYDGIIWIGLGTSLPEFHGIGWNGKMWVGVGSRAGYSYDGKTWYAVDLPSSCGYGMFLTWNGQMWIAATLGNSSSKTSTLAYSIDGIQWYALGKTGMDDGVGIGSDQLSDFVSVELSQVHVACGGVSHTLAYSYDGINWNGLGTSIFSTEGMTAATNGKLWVAGGIGTNTLAYSYNGIKWFGLGTSIFPVGCNYIASNSTMWIAGGYVGATSTGLHSMAYSYDGINWIGLGKTIFDKSCTCIAWNGTLWVASGWDTSKRLAYSYDGITWLKADNTLFSDSCDSIAWSGTRWVASGIGGAAYSSDGISWSALVSLPVRGQWVAWNGTTFILVGGLSRVFRSLDGIAWAEKTHSLTSGTARGVVWTGKRWLIFAESTSNIPYSIDNGDTWINSTSPFSKTIGGTVGTNGIQGYASPTGNSIQIYQPHVACGYGNNTLAYSNDGITWSGLGKAIFDLSGIAVMYNDSLWIAGGKGTVHTMAYSYDGLTWTGLGKQIFTLSCEKLYYYKNRWLAGGNGTNTMAYSYDGITWTLMGQGIFTGFCYTFASNGTIWVAGGTGTNSLAYSYDGITWIGNSTSPFTVCHYIVWNGTLWVAAGNNGMAYSYDGINWSRSTSSITTAMSLAWNGTMFAAVGVPYNLIAFSNDGINWNSTTFSGFSGLLRDILWTGHLWIIFAENSPTMKYSFDGKKWIDTTSTVFTHAIGGAVADGRLSDTANITTDSYYQSGYKTITFSTNQTN
jgi:hypothetical protein